MQCIRENALRATTYVGAFAGRTILATNGSAADGIPTCATTVWAAIWTAASTARVVGAATRWSRMDSM